MERIASRKVHFAPLIRQQKAIERLLREGRVRNVTEFMREAIDYYLDTLGRPSLSEQARQMAAEHEGHASSESLQSASLMQHVSMQSDEDW